MVIFEDIEDVKEWLEPLDYLGFWDAIEPYFLTVQDRDHCDGLISAGTVEPALILEELKYMAQLEIAQKLKLNYLTYHPVVSAMH